LELTVPAFPTATFCDAPSLDEAAGPLCLALALTDAALGLAVAFDLGATVDEGASNDLELDAALKLFKKLLKPTPGISASESSD
jgi:hypothetical protein